MLYETVSRMLKRNGRAHTIRQTINVAAPNDWTPGTKVVAYTVVKAMSRGYRPHEITGTILERDIKITMDGSQPVSPQPGDEIAVGSWDDATHALGRWAKVINPYEREISDKVAVIKIQARY